MRLAWTTRVAGLALLAPLFLLDPARAADPPGPAPAPPAESGIAAPSGAPGDSQVSVDSRNAEQALEDVVVLSAKRPQPLREAAASTSVITSADLAAFGWRDFTEAVASLSGFYTTDNRDAVYLGVRGVALHGDTNGRVLILVDGHTQNELWAHSAYTDQIGLDASMIDHIEVLRGPASSLYGSLGFLAIINIVTRRGTTEHWARATFDLDHGRGFRLAASVGHRFRNGLEFGLSAQARKFLGAEYTWPEIATPQPGDDPNRFLDRNGGVSRPGTSASQGLSLFGHLDYRGFSLKGSYQYFDNHIPFAPFGTVFNSPVNRFVTSRAYLDAGYEAGRPEVVQLTLRGYFDVAGYSDDLANPRDADGNAAYVFRDQANPYWAGGELKLFLSREWRDVRAAVTVGGDVTWLHGDNVSGTAEDIAAGKPDVAIDEAILLGAVYGQAEVTWARSIALTLGLRGDFSDRYPSELSPRAGLVLFPHGTSTVKLLYAHGFIFPSWYQTFFNDRTSILDNRMLAPERADNYELVFQQQLGKPLLLTASLFYIHGDRLIEQRSVCAELDKDGRRDDLASCPDETRRRMQSINATSFQSRGGELTLTGRFPFGLRLFANYTLAFARDGEGNHAVDSPRHLFKAGISVPLWRDHLFLGAEGRVWSARRLMPGSTESTDPVALLSANVSWRDLPRGLSVMLKVINLTGQTWYEPSITEDSHPVLRVPHGGPTVIARLGYEY